jgi:hypothetical protein
VAVVPGVVMRAVAAAAMTVTVGHKHGRQRASRRRVLACAHQLRQSAY